MTRKQFNQVLTNYIVKEKAAIAEHEEIRAILLPLVGKPINHKTLNQKVLGKFSLKITCSMYYIKGQVGEHLIGYCGSSYSKENLISVEKTDYSRGFDYFDACHGEAARQRIKQIETADKDGAYKLFAGIAKHFDALRTLFGDIERQNFGSYHFPPYYDLLGAMYANVDRRDVVKLSDFYFIRK